MSDLRAIRLADVEMGTVSSMKDGSVKFTIYTCELRPSESAALLPLHGKACALLIEPHTGEALEMVEVNTERNVKTPSQRQRAAFFVLWKKATERGKTNMPFDTFLAKEQERIMLSIGERIDALGG